MENVALYGSCHFGTPANSRFNSNVSSELLTDLLANRKPDAITSYGSLFVRGLGSPEGREDVFDFLW